MVHTDGMHGETPGNEHPGGTPGVADAAGPGIDPSPPRENERNRRWAATMAGHGGDGVTFAHRDSHATVGSDLPAPGFDRLAREADPRAIREWAGRFDAARFAPEMQAAIDALVARARSGATA